MLRDGIAITDNTRFSAIAFFHWWCATARNGSAQQCRIESRAWQSYMLHRQQYQYSNLPKQDCVKTQPISATVHTQRLPVLRNANVHQHVLLPMPSSTEALNWRSSVNMPLINSGMGG